MTPEQFVYWLQGFVELHGEYPTEEQWDSIKAHLKLCFNKVTPEVKKDEPAKNVNVTKELEEYIRKFNDKSNIPKIDWPLIPSPIQPKWPQSPNKYYTYDIIC